MKTFTTIFTILALISIGFSATKVDLDSPFEGDSLVGLIMIMAALCALVLVYILMASRKIQDNIKKKR